MCDPQLISEVPITSGADAVIARRPGVAARRAQRKAVSYIAPLPGLVRAPGRAIVYRRDSQAGWLVR